MKKSPYYRVMKALSCAFLPIAFFLLLRFGFGLVILTNETHSLPYTFFLYPSKAKRGAFKKGDFVLFHHPLSKSPIVKKVSGMEGDRILKTQDFVKVNDLLLPLKKRDSKGNALDVLKADFIQKDHIFVSGSHLNSLDSRYEKFGLLNLSHVKGVVWPLF